MTFWYFFIDLFLLNIILIVIFDVSFSTDVDVIIKELVFSFSKLTVKTFIQTKIKIAMEIKRNLSKKLLVIFHIRWGKFLEISNK